MGQEQVGDGWSAVAREHSYTVARGVRALALVGNCIADDLTMRDTLERLQIQGEQGAIAFVLDRGDGFADFGYAGAAWAHDLYKWAVQQADDMVPRDQRHRIIGLLLGYSIEAVSRFDETLPYPCYPPPPTTSASAV